MTTAMLGALAMSGIVFAQRGQLPAECRQEIVDLCRGAQGGLRHCIRTALPRLSDKCRKSLGARQMAPIPGATEHSYGWDARQRLDLVRPEGKGRAPVLLFIHGGGWSIGDKRHAAAPKAKHFTGKGWAFGSVNYRLVPQATVEQQAADISSAIAWIRANAAGQGLDPDRIVLMGHSAGAHLAALVGADQRYLDSADVPLAAVRGVILLDGAGYDVPAQMAVLPKPLRPMFEAAFGTDPARQGALSPVRHAGSPNAASWLILPVAGRSDAIAQSNRLASGLKAAGTSASVVPVPSATHMTLNRGLGTSGDFATEQVDRFLERLR